MFQHIVDSLRASESIAAKADIAAVSRRLGLSGSASIRVGDDCAAIPDGDGYLLLAIEGFINAFVADDPWFAGWCGVMVNVSDIAAMGGRPIAVVDAIWSPGEAAADPILQGLHDAAATFDVPLVGGHSNLRTDRAQLSVAILGRAKRLLTSFDAKPREHLIGAIDLRGGYRDRFSNWEATTGAPASRLRGDLEILPLIAETHLSATAKDISQGGIIGTAMMLAECSSVGLHIDLAAVPRPDGVPLDRWLQTFPSFGYILTATSSAVPAIISRFTERGIHAADIGAVTADQTVRVELNNDIETIWDFTRQPLLGLAHA